MSQHARCQRLVVRDARKVFGIVAVRVNFTFAVHVAYFDDDGCVVHWLASKAVDYEKGEYQGREDSDAAHQIFDELFLLW